MKRKPNRPRGVTALSVFFLVGAVISFTASVSLVFPNSLMEPMWRLNPRARIAFASMGSWAVVLLIPVSFSCATAAVGLWRGARWGHRVALSLIAINLIADVANTLMGLEPRAIVGVPIAAGILWYLASKRVRQFFSKAAGAEFKIAGS